MGKILVTGASGQLGTTFQQIHSNYLDYNFYFADRNQLDISNSQQVDELVRSEKFDWIINCAAYTQVDKAESQSELCNLINEQGALNLAQSANKINGKIIHISSDYVYHSNFGKPFSEKDITNPQSVYAKSKLAGELAVASNCASHYILRTSWVYAEHGNNFVRTMLRLGMERDNLSVVCDQIGAPTYTLDLALVIMSIIEQNKGAFGTYNFANSGQTSWYNLTRSIHNHLGIDCLITPIRTDEYPTMAARPPYSVMNLDKIQNTFKIELRDWEEALLDCLDRVPTNV